MRPQYFEKFSIAYARSNQKAFPVVIAAKRPATVHRQGLTAPAKSKRLCGHSGAFGFTSFSLKRQKLSLRIVESRNATWPYTTRFMPYKLYTTRTANYYSVATGTASR